jgi:hypothetical protein
MRLFLISKQIKASGMCNQVNIVKRRVCGIVERETHRDSHGRAFKNEKREKIKPSASPLDTGTQQGSAQVPSVTGLSNS